MANARPMRGQVTARAGLPEELRSSFLGVETFQEYSRTCWGCLEARQGPRRSAGTARRAKETRFPDGRVLDANKYWEGLGAIIGEPPPEAISRSFLRPRAPQIPQVGALQRTKSWSKPNLTYRVWVLSLAFLGLEGDLVSFHVCAAIPGLRNPFAAKLGPCQA